MKKSLYLAAVLVLSLLLSACGISQAELDAAVSEREQWRAQYDEALAARDALQSRYDEALAAQEELQTRYDRLSAEYNELNGMYEALVEETDDWRALTEEEKAAELAQAQADRIAAEEAAKKAEEERAAAERAAAEEAERKAAEEAARLEAEEKKGYNTGITYDELARNPDAFEGKKVKFTGQVLQVSELTNELQIRLATKANGWGGYSDNVVYLYFPSSLTSARILEKDIITVYGVAKGLHSYTTVLGAVVTLPLIAVDKIDT